MIQKQFMSEQSKIYFIDLFCGAGGVTTGIHEATINSKKIASVLACVNHDELAIKSHQANHPDTLHYIEDIRTLDISEIEQLVYLKRIAEPDCIVALWASLECTNFSKAKGGQPRDADSRTLAEHLFRYIEKINPDYIWIENVEEFMCWGPLDDNGKPISKHNGTDYMRWVNAVKSYGYEFDWKILNSADYGAYTSRKRFFAQFAKRGLPIKWPLATHSKNTTNDLFGGLKKWKAVKDVLDFNDEGTSIFVRKKELSEKTLERIYAGLVKYVAGGKKNFILKYNSTDKNGKHIPPSIDNPAPVITCQGRLGLVNVSFLSKYFSGNPEHKNISVEGPAHTIKCVDNHALVNVNFITKYYGTGKNIVSTENICPTLTTKDRMALVQPKFFISRDFKTATHSDVNVPAGTITTVPKMHLVKCEPWIMNTNFSNIGSSINEPAHTITANRKHHYLMNPQWFNKSAASVDNPCFTLIARMDKTPPYLVTADTGEIAIKIEHKDTEAMKKIKYFMAEFGIIDIKMRMLRVPELLRIQGFSDKYFLAGNQSDQKKFIGNSVPPLMVSALIKAMHMALCNLECNYEF